MGTKVYVVSLDELEEKINEITYENVLNIIPGHYPSGQQYFVIIAQEAII